MRKVEIMDEEILVVKQALVLYKEKMQEENNKVSISEIEIIDKIINKIKEEFKK